jgi:hypothetical protein
MELVNKVLIIGLVILIILGLLYGAMVISTNSIYHYIQQVIKKEIMITNNKDPLIYFSDASELKDAAYSKFEFKRKNIFHNFNVGQMTIVFSENVFDENGNLIHQFKNIEVVIHIKKHKGEWTVTNIKRVI